MSIYADLEAVKTKILDFYCLNCYNNIYYVYKLKINLKQTVTGANDEDNYRWLLTSWRNTC